MAIGDMVMSLEQGKFSQSRPWIALNDLKPNRMPSSIVLDDEHELVTAAKAGDLRSFDEIVNRYERKILRLTSNITRNREDAEDAMQDAFLKAFTHLDTFQGDSRFYTWLVRIAANEALMRLRKRRPSEFSIDESKEGDEDLMPRELEEWRPNPEEQYARSEMAGILAELIEKLDEDFRIVFVLRDVEGLSNEETSALLGISVPAIKSRLLRARLKMRQRLNRYFRQEAPN